MKRILIVEDEAIIAESIKVILEGEGYDVVGKAYTMDEAVKLAREKSPDLAIIDVVLKDGDGIKAAEEIIEVLNIPVIFITAYSDAGTLERALKTRPYAYLIKPFEERELLGVVKISLARAESERKLERLKTLLEFLNLARERILRCENTEELSGQLCYEVVSKFFKNCAILLFENGELKSWKVNLETLNEEFEKAIESGEIPGCIKNTGEEAVLLKNQREECNKCPLKEVCEKSGSLLLRFKGRDELYGAMLLSPPGEWGSEEYINYLKGFSQDISLALESLKIEKEREEALVSLENSLSFLQALFSSMREMVFAFDDQMRFTFVHSPEEELLLVKKEEIIGRTPDELLPREIAQKFRQAFEENKRGKVEVYDYKLKVKGKERWFSVSQSPLIIGGDFAGALAVVRDITSKKELEEQLKEREKKYRTLFENVPVGLYRSTPEGKIVEANPAFLRILGYERMDLSSLRAEELFLKPEDRERWREMLEEKSILKKEYQLRRKDGEIIWVRDFVRVTVQDGRKYYEGAIQDITEVKRKQEELHSSISRLRRLFNETVSALGAVVEMKDPYTSGHQMRVSQLAVAIAHDMGLPQDKIELIGIAGLLHDIGKLAIPSEILVKPGKLSPQERELVKLHPKISYDILSRIDFPWPVAEVVLQHHERLDGSGYPRGLKGHEMMKEAKILAVADVVEAISSHRPYRPALGIDKALEEINRGRGSLYDPDVVDATLRVFKKGFRFKNSFFAPGRPGK